MIDIVVPFYNQGTKLRACLRALDASVSAGVRIILVDDASAPEEAASARAAAASMRHPVEFIVHETNRGFRDSVMDAITASSNEYVVLVNSDTIVTPGFADLLVEVMRRTPDVAAVAPVSNTNADLFQFRPGFPETPPDFASLVKAVLTHAKTRRVEFAGKVTEAPYLTGMCLAFNRAAAEEVGWFGSDYVHGYFEDLDLCCRLRAEGRRLAIREDCFVYHAGHASYGSMDRAWLVPALMNNYRLFSARWEHLPEHEELVRLIRQAGQTDAISTTIAETAHV